MPTLKSKRPVLKRDRLKAAEDRKKAAEAVTQLVFTRGGDLSLEKPPKPAVFAEIPHPQKRLYLQAIAEVGPRYDYAARAAGIDLRTGHYWRVNVKDVAFQQALEQAIKLGIEGMESEFVRRGFKGYDSPVYQQGKLVGTKRSFDTTAGIFMLKATDPEKYRERFDYEHSGRGGQPITLAVAHMAMLTPEQLAAELQRTANALGAPIDVPVLSSLPVEPPKPQSLLPAETAPQVEPESPEARYAKVLAERAKANGHE